MKLVNKVVLITGSSGSIGRATALAFAGLGARVVVNSRLNVNGGMETVANITKLGNEAIYVKADVTQPEDVSFLFEQILSAYGTIDILINNAGGAVGKPFSETTKEDWTQAFEQNVVSAVLCSQEAIQIMRSQSKMGKIINTASVRGIAEVGRQSIMAYSASKAALINFTKTLAKELAPLISVNAIAPGFVSNPYYDNLPEDLKKSFIDNTLIQRFLTPEEIASSFVYLATAEGITGQVIVVDGGFTLKLA